MARIVAQHYTDPGCPWAYSARPYHARLRWRFGDQLTWETSFIGLTESAQQYVDRGYTPERSAHGWRMFRERFGMPFGGHVKERPAATSPACRALVVVREDAPARLDAALRALQFLNFSDNGLLDDTESIRTALDGVEGVHADATVARLDDDATWAAYERDRAAARTAAGSPTEAQDRAANSDGQVRYTAPSIVFSDGNGGRAEAGGFQPFEGYDLALANLDPTLERRPAPENAGEALSAFPDGLTTAEVAQVLRRSDLVDPDPEHAELELLSLVANGQATREPVGHDAVWRPA